MLAWWIVVFGASFETARRRMRAQLARGGVEVRRGQEAGREALLQQEDRARAAEVAGDRC